MQNDIGAGFTANRETGRTGVIALMYRFTITRTDQLFELGKQAAFVEIDRTPGETPLARPAPATTGKHKRP